MIKLKYNLVTGHSHRNLGYKTTCHTWNYIAILYSVADPGCLSRIQDPNFSQPGFRIRIKEFHLGSGFRFFTHPESRIQGSKSTGCRIRIRNNEIFTVLLGDVHLGVFLYISEPLSQFPPICVWTNKFV